MMELSGIARAWLATVVFGGAGLWAIYFHGTSWSMALPHAIFFAVLVLNTFFSIRFWTPLTPPSISQMLIDGALSLSYIALALSIGLPVPFAYFALVLFLLAPVKYALLIERIPHTALVRKKVLIDLTGAACCALILGITLLGYAAAGAWALAVTFALANICFLVIRPMYRL